MGPLGSNVSDERLGKGLAWIAELPMRLHARAHFCLLFIAIGAAVRAFMVFVWHETYAAALRHFAIWVGVTLVFYFLSLVSFYWRRRSAKRSAHASGAGA